MTNRGSISIGAGWDAEQSAPTGKAGQKSAAQMSTAASYVKNPAIDIDLAMCVFDKDAKLLDYIGYMEAVKPNGEMAMTLKSSKDISPRSSPPLARTEIELFSTSLSPTINR